MQAIRLWPTALEALRALGRQYTPEMNRVAAELRLPDWHGWLLEAWLFTPEPISAARLRLRSPYTSPQWYNERLAAAAGQGFLAEVPGTPQAYSLTELGRWAAERLVEAGYAQMTTLQPLPEEALEHLADLLMRLVRSCLAAPEPPEKECLRLSRRMDPGAEACGVIRIDQYLSDLAAYRDDAHLAAWRPHAVEGPAWEAFTYLWRGEAATLDDLCQKLKHRGFTREDYQCALAALLERGWVAESAGAYRVTEVGNEIRQAAEETTDRYFYAPWACLSAEEVADLQSALVRFRDAL
ncbi:hypothetical protein SE15_13245 [Thermanaerothrix daxensis]|uniref:Uncharacterized protein n=1 Tax=Thermanaerothrix daxensis TaxID=869279 RepID=A0A0P6XFQ1_9CHLR|nr:hypothetical protein [Thermanaerothrix daxensis]KPL82071.1 hypothetical protein SE15_13245 [Thermanaerothrix daxensis]